MSALTGVFCALWLALGCATLCTDAQIKKLSKYKKFTKSWQTFMPQICSQSIHTFENLQFIVQRPASFSGKGSSGAQTSVKSFLRIQTLNRRITCIEFKCSFANIHLSKFIRDQDFTAKLYGVTSVLSQSAKSRSSLQYVTLHSRTFYFVDK